MHCTSQQGDSGMKNQAESVAASASAAVAVLSHLESKAISGIVATFGATNQAEQGIQADAWKPKRRLTRRWIEGEGSC